MMKIEISFSGINHSVRINSLVTKVVKKTLLEIDSTNKQDLELSVLIVSSKKMKFLNQKYRNINKPTNVLSFPQIEFGQKKENNFSSYILGDLVLSPQIIKDESKKRKISFENHFSHIVVHGLLHLFGYDHDCRLTEKAMTNKEINILKKINIENPYPEMQITKS